MHRVLAATLVTLALAVGASADEANLADLVCPAPSGSGLSRSIADSFPSPTVAPMGVDWVPDERGGRLLHAEEDSGNIYWIDEGGMGEFLLNVPSVLGHAGLRANGIHYRAEAGSAYIYVTDYNGDLGASYDDAVYRLSPDGSGFVIYEVESFCDGVVGITFDGTHFWLSCLTQGEVIQCDTNLVMVASFPHPSGSGGGGIDYDPTTGLFYLSDYWTPDIYVCDAEMNVVDIIAGPGPGCCSLGVAVGDVEIGRYLWVTNFESDRFYKIDDEYYNPVEEMSWGTIKATHR